MYQQYSSIEQNDRKANVKRSPTLENQIESMLDGIIGEDNDNVSLHFSEEEDYPEKDNRFRSNLIPPIKFERSPKKYQTVSFRKHNKEGKQIQNNFNNCSSSCVTFNLYPSPMMNMQMYQNQTNYPQTNTFMFNSNQTQPQIKRGEDRKKSYEPNQLKKIQQQMLGLQNNNTINNNGSSMMRELNQMSRKEKRFNTTAFPKGVDMQVEMLLYEINDDLIRMEKIDYFIYSKLKGNFINVIKTHKGSRIFQNYLKKTPSDIIHFIFIEIKGHIVDIMCDFYGNYFCKKFFGVLNKKDRIDFINAIKSYFVKLSFDNVGTFPIQGIIEQVNSNYEKKFILSLVKNGLSLFCYNPSGAHVIEKIISCFEIEYIQFIFDFCIQSFLALSKDASGICVIKKVIDSQREKSPYFTQLKKLIIDNMQLLINHQFGNQVIQTAIQTWDDENVNVILHLLQNNLAALSMGKYSSNVIEKCLEKKEEILGMFINEICMNNQLGQVMKNSFGNYVIQKALKLSRGNNERILAENVTKNIYKLNDKKLIAKWKNIVMPHLDNYNVYNEMNNNDS